MEGKSYINGADYFQLYLDRENKKRGAASNVVRLLITLDGKIDLQKLKTQLESSKTLSQINGLELESEKLGNYYYWRKGQKSSVSVSIKNWDGALNSLQPFTELQEGYWLSIELLEGKENDVVLFHIHHLVTDNKGLQDLILQLNSDLNKDIGSVPEMNKCGTAKSFFQKTWKMLDPKSGDMVTFSAKKKKQNKIKYYTLSKKLSEIDAINQVLSGVVLPGSSTVFLNHIAAEMEKWSGQSGSEKYFWVPVPANRRKKNLPKGFYLGNQLSILFYNIAFGQTEEERLQNLQDQIVEQVRNKTVVDYEQLTNTMTKFPYPLYKAMLELPDSGKFCSFTFSDLGYTFKNQDQFLGHKIKDVINFPSVPLAPGLIFVTMSYKDRFHLVLGVDENILSEKEANQIMKNLETRFVG